MTRTVKDKQKKDFEWRFGQESSTFFILAMVFFIIALSTDNWVFIFTGIAFIFTGISMGYWSYSKNAKKNAPQQQQPSQVVKDPEPLDPNKE